MASTIGNIFRLTRAGIVLAQHGVRFVPAGTKVPFALHLARAATLPIRALTWPFRIGQPKHRRVAGALTSLGPSYIKLGQFLATRDDIIGRELAADLATLQDRLPPFSQRDARKAVEEALGAPIDTLFAELGPPVAAASIAQVHKAEVRAADGTLTPVAVKVLRPGIEQRFHRDLDSYFFAARMVERFHVRSRRLRPVAVVDTLAKSDGDPAHRAKLDSLARAAKKRSELGRTSS
jgi:ubiquinone biosynthesis protein